jgi:hypothetical protein
MKVNVYLEMELILLSLYMGECMNQWTNIHVALQFLTNWFCSKPFGSSTTINIHPMESWILILSYQLKYEHAYVIILSINDLKLSGWTFEIVTHEMLL